MISHPDRFTIDLSKDEEDLLREQMAMPSVIDSEANDDGKEATEQCASWEVDRMRTVDHESGAALGAQVRRHLAAQHLPPPAPPGPLQRQIDRTAAEREGSLQRLMSQLPPSVPQVTPPPPVAVQDGARVRETFRTEMPQHGRQHPLQSQQPRQTHCYQHIPGACAPFSGTQQPVAPSRVPQGGPSRVPCGCMAHVALPAPIVGVFSGATGCWVLEKGAQAPGMCW